MTSPSAAGAEALDATAVATDGPIDPELAAREAASLRVGLEANKAAALESLAKLYARRAESTVTLDAKIAETERMIDALNEQLGA